MRSKIYVVVGFQDRVENVEPESYPKTDVHGLRHCSWWSKIEIVYQHCLVRNPQHYKVFLQAPTLHKRCGSRFEGELPSFYSKHDNYRYWTFITSTRHTCASNTSRSASLEVWKSYGDFDTYTSTIASIAITTRVYLAAPGRRGIFS